MTGEQKSSSITNFCLNCLCENDAIQLCAYEFQSRAFKAIFEMEQLMLCYICCRLARNAEKFIRNVVNNQFLLQRCDIKNPATLETIKQSTNTSMCLKYAALESINLIGSDDKRVEEKQEDKSSKIKLEPVFIMENEEMNLDSSGVDDFADNITAGSETSKNGEDDFPKEKIDSNGKKNFCCKVDNITAGSETSIIEKDDYPKEKIDSKGKSKDFQNFSKADDITVGSETSIIEEDDYPKEKKDSNGKMEDLQNFSEADNITSDSETSTEEDDDYPEENMHLNDRQKEEFKYLQNFCIDSIIEMLTISNEQCLEERAQKRLEENYLNSPYRCDDCVKSFCYKDSFEKHMELHSESKGDFKCNICKIRQPTHYAISQHKQRLHHTRYRCRECGLTRIDRRSMVEHYIAIHKKGQFTCDLCCKSYTRWKSLKKHTQRTHETREKVQCEHCDKFFKCKEFLKEHIHKIHMNLPVRPKKKPYLCTECGASFKAPSTLKTHAYTHTDSREFYCVECDKHFKTLNSLNSHLKSTPSHTEYSKLPFQCTQCEKRFAYKRSLDYHMNRIHLNIKPHQCDQCEKGFFHKLSYERHRARVHENNPLAKPDQPRLPCSFCNKTFRAKSTLKSHIRVHTGERPFKCVQCNADFSQSGSLHNHIKLVHLGLTRKRTPKGQKKAEKKPLNKTKKLSKKLKKKKESKKLSS